MAKYFKAKEPIYDIEMPDAPQHIALSVDYCKKPGGASGYRATVGPVQLRYFNPEGPSGFIVGKVFDKEYFTYYDDLSVLVARSERRSPKREAAAKQWAREHEAELVQGYINGVKALGGRDIELTGESWGEI